MQLILLLDSEKLMCGYFLESSILAVYHLSQILFIREMSEAQSSQLHYSD